MNKPPKGCDQQGRYPQAAEAATEVGADDDLDYAPMVKKIAMTVTVISIVSLVLIMILGV